MIGRALRGEGARRLGGRLIGVYLGLALRTTRWRFDVPPESWPFLTGADGRTVILAFWHEFLPMAPALWMRARAANPDLRVSVLISRHRDGRMITDIIGRWGMDVVAGSSARQKPGGRDKGGVAAVRTLLDTLRGGSLVAITPDGPRGPRRTLQPGVARLAAMSGVPVVACAGMSRAHRRLRSWDRMVLPLPFGRGRIVCSAPLVIVPEERDTAHARIARAMADTAHEAERQARPMRQGRFDGPPGPTVGFRIWGIAGTLSVPALRFLLRRRLRAGKEIAGRLDERTGRDHTQRPAGRLVWLHAASVGETLSLLPLIAALGRQDPALVVLLTTGTATAQTLAAERLQAERTAAAPGAAVLVRLVPLDVPSWVERFLVHWRPDLLVLVESELWPTLIGRCSRQGIPMALVNARLSERSARRWALSGAIGRQIFDAFALVWARSQQDAARLRRLGVVAVEYEGDLKRAAAPLPCDEKELQRLHGLIGDRRLWLAASTHENEEVAALALHDALRARHPELLLVIAPRHPQRADAVAELISGACGDVRRRSRGEDPRPGDGVWLCDTVGELGLLYRLCPVVVLGNSFAEAAGRGGGHNPLEPARLGCALGTGPRMENFAEDTRALAAVGGLAVLPDRAAMLDWLDRMLSDGDQARRAATQAAAVLDGASDLPERLAGRLLAMISGGTASAGTA